MNTKEAKEAWIKSLMNGKSDEQGFSMVLNRLKAVQNSLNQYSEVDDDLASDLFERAVTWLNEAIEIGNLIIYKK